MPATSLKQVETETENDWEICGTLQTHPLHLERSTGSPLTGDGVMIRHVHAQKGSQTRTRRKLQHFVRHIVVSDITTELRDTS